jgi:hypothetical protein
LALDSAVVGSKEKNVAIINTSRYINFKIKKPEIFTSGQGSSSGFGGFNMSNFHKWSFFSETEVRHNLSVHTKCAHITVGRPCQA